MTGDISVTFDGHETVSLIGGCQIYQDRADAARVGGDITVKILSGRVEDLTGGSKGRDGNVGNTPVLAPVDGDVIVTVGQKDAPAKTAVVGDLWGGGKFASCNSVTFNVEDGAYIGYSSGGAFYGMVAAGGHACTVHTTVTTNVNGGQVGVLYAAGIGEFQMYGDRYNQPMYIGDSSNDQPGDNMPLKDQYRNEIYGNIYIEMNGGKVVQYALSYMYNRTYGDCTLHVYGGTVSYSSAVMGDSFGYPLEDIDGYVLGDTNLIFDGNLGGCGSAGADITDSVFKGWKQIKNYPCG